MIEMVEVDVEQLWFEIYRRVGDTSGGETTFHVD